MPTEEKVPETFTQTTRDPNAGKLESDEKEFDKNEARKPKPNPAEEEQP